MCIGDDLCAPAFVDLSGIPTNVSDSLWVPATGGGFGACTPYSDSNESLLTVVRPVVVNGIADVATRSDFLDRGINLRLHGIPESKRRDEAGLWREFNEEDSRNLHRPAKDAELPYSTVHRFAAGERKRIDIVTAPTPATALTLEPRKANRWTVE